MAFAIGLTVESERSTWVTRCCAATEKVVMIGCVLEFGQFSLFELVHVIGMEEVLYFEEY